ncbi:MAG: glycosyltransferase family 4 protein [Thermodesulfobacteriota bacterium]
MRVLHINTSDVNGGAARAVFRLHQALLQHGVDSRMLVQIKGSDDPAVSGPLTKLSRGIGYIRPTVDQLPLKWYPKSGQGFFHPAVVPFSGIHHRIKEINPDVVHLHWITGGFLRVEDLAHIKRPVIWTLHDMWAFTGGCHYDDDCGKHASLCESCPMLGSFKKDLSTRVFLRKLRAYSKLQDMIIVSPSRWLAALARDSRLLKNKRIANIPYTVDPHVFRPIPKSLAKEAIGLPKAAKVVLIGADKVLQDQRKGFSKLCQALSEIKSVNMELVVFGAGRPQRDFPFDFPVHYLGKLHDDLALKVAYNAADVVVAPSLQENLSCVILESLSCGTPVVGFRIGGNADMISHKWNGYLSEPYDPSDLARGIIWALEHPDPAALSQHARMRIVDNFNAGHVADRYIELYQQISVKN